MRFLLAVMMLFGLSELAYAQIRLGEPQLAWYTLHTEHFRVTFPVGLEGLAQEAAVAAEDAYQYLFAQFGYAPSEKLDIVLCDATDTAHRELEIFQDRITICVAQGDVAERFNPKFPSWVQQSVFLEYAQFVSADLVFGFSEVLRPLVGKLILPNFKSQELLEGIGEYLAEEALSTPPDVRPGIGGEHWVVRYLAERFGPDFLKAWHQLQANDPKAALTFGLLSDRDRILRRLTGKSFAEIFTDFHIWLREKLPTKQTISWPFPPSTMKIKRDVQKSSYLYGDLYLYDPVTKRETRLTEGARIYRAVPFPNGQKILVARYRWGDQGPALAIFDLKTKQIETLKEFPLHDYFIDSFAISPDGETVALSIWRRGGFQDIYLMDLSRTLTQITRDRALDITPTFSPDGHFVLFTSDRDGSFKPYAYRLSDGAFFAVTDALDPQSWKPVQIEPEPFPPWDGFPDTEYPIMPYDPRPSLAPKILVPWPSLSSISLLTFGSDALREHRYSVWLGFNWKTLQPSYSVRYENRVLLASLEALLVRDGLTAHQAVTATLPLATSLSTQQSLSLFYRRDEAALITHQIGLGWRGSWRVFQNELELSLWAVTQTHTGQRIWENSVGWRLGVTAELSTHIKMRIFVERSGQLGAELTLLPDELVRLGILWDAQSIRFYLR